MKKQLLKELVKKAVLEIRLSHPDDAEAFSDDYEEQDNTMRGEALLDSFKNMLKEHDWTYMYSDSQEVWKRGLEKQKAIIKTFEDLVELGKGEEAKELYNQKHIYYFKKEDPEIDSILNARSNF